MTERKIVKIVDVDGAPISGTNKQGKPYQILKFRIEDEEHNEVLGVTAFNSAFFPLLKPEAALDCDIETKQSGNFINRTLTQVYVDGKPMVEKKAFAGGGYRGKSPEELIIERRSIERQTSLKLAVEYWGDKERDLFQVFTVADAFYKWVSMGGNIPDKPATPVIATPQPLKQVTGGIPLKPTVPPVSDEKIPQNIGDLYTAYLSHFTPGERRKINAKTDIVNINPAIDLTDIPKAWKEIKARKNWK